MTLKRIKSNPEFKEKVTNSSIPVLLKFGASWCGPCKLMEPVLDALQKEYEGRIAFYEIDIDEYRDKVREMDIRAAPTIKLIHSKGMVHSTMLGSSSVAKIREALDKFLDSIQAPESDRK